MISAIFVLRRRVNIDAGQRLSGFGPTSARAPPPSRRDERAAIACEEVGPVTLYEVGDVGEGAPSPTSC